MKICEHVPFWFMKTVHERSHLGSSIVCLWFEAYVTEIMEHIIDVFVLCPNMLRAVHATINSRESDGGFFDILCRPQCNHRAPASDAFAEGVQTIDSRI